MKIKWIALMLIAFVRCQSGHTLRVSFDSADRVKRGDIVLFGNTKIGSVKNVKADVVHRAATITLLLGKSVQVPMFSEFILAYDAFGTPFITISASGEKRTIDWNQVQHGKVRDAPPDIISPDRQVPSPDGLRPSIKH
jgi:ABC-type transporter Mla subunit MlaD